MDAPLFKRLKEEERVAKEKLEQEGKVAKEKLEQEETRVKDIINKYKGESLKKEIFKAISEKQKNTYIKAEKFELSQIQKIGVIFSDYRYKKFWKLEVIIYLDNNEKKSNNIYIYDLNISKKMLKSIGGKADIEF